MGRFSEVLWNEVLKGFTLSVPETILSVSSLLLDKQLITWK